LPRPRSAQWLRSSGILNEKNFVIVQQAFPIYRRSIGSGRLYGGEMVGASQSKGPFPPQVFLMLLVVQVIGFVLHKLFRDLVDEVWDDGNALVVKHEGRETQIPLAEIINIGYCGMMNPPRATLTLRNTTDLGKEVSFVVQRPFVFTPFARNPIIDELILRVDAARRKA
jgi:hypothetical protein